jgi:PTS system mannose-specific IIA component
MVGIVVVGHGRLAEEMVKTLESALGHIDAIEGVATETGDSPDQVRARIEAAIEHVDRGGGVVILTDILGDTATNQSLALARAFGGQVVAGVNMPMLIKATSARAKMDPAALAAFLQRYGQEHIVWPTAPLPERQQVGRGR